MTARHLTAFAGAVIALAIFAAGAVLYAQHVEAFYTHAFADAHFPQKTLGSALQAEAFRQADLLPVYGSSEIYNDNPFHASRLFMQYPTGFRIFPVATLGATPLMLLQRLAAVGSAMRGRKVVVSIGPTSIYHDRKQAIYDGGFSRLQASALVFSLSLPYSLKQEAAARLLNYPETIGNDDLLSAALHALSDDSLKGRVLYALLVPPGKLQEWTLRLVDHWNVLTRIQIRGHQAALNETHVSHAPDWPSLYASAERVAEERSNNNPFGIDNRIWRRRSRPDRETGRRTLTPMAAVEHLESALKVSSQHNWIDVDLLLDALAAFGAKPLLLSAPFSGLYYDYWGVDTASRHKYYDTLRDIAARHHVPLLDFDDHDLDTHFVIDASSHLSAKAWVYYDRAMDDFFHDRSIAHAAEEAHR